MSEIRKEFDRHLFELKLQEASRRMHAKTQSRWRSVGYDQRKLGQGEGAGFYKKLVDHALASVLLVGRAPTPP